MTSKRTAASNNHLHNGTTQAIRDVLRRQTDPISCDRIAHLIGMKPEKVKASLSQLVTSSGGIVTSKGPRCTLYALYRPPERTETALPTVAARREPIDRGPLRRDPFAHMRLNWR